MTLSLFTLVFTCLTCFIDFSLTITDECQNVRVSEQEISDIFFKNYGVWQRPVLSPETAIDVNLTFILSSINDVVEKEKAVKLSGYLDVTWFSEFHVWKDKYPYYCIPYIVLPAQDVWLPDIVQQNNRQSRYALMTMPGEKVRVHSNGLTQYSPGGHIEAACQFDLSLFPFDVQECALKLERFVPFFISKFFFVTNVKFQTSWRYSSKSVRFQLPKKNILLRDFLENMQWHLEGTYQELSRVQSEDATSAAFDHVDFYIIISRKVTHYV